MASKQNIKAIDAWQAENVERIVIKPNKKDRISVRIDAVIEAIKASGRKPPSRQAYILEAIREKLERDGIPEIENGSDE